MTECTTQSAPDTPTSRGQCSSAAARRNRFWRACNRAFLAIHLFALVIVGFMVGDGWLFRLVATSIVAGPVLTYMAHRKPTQEVSHG